MGFLRFVLAVFVVIQHLAAVRFLGASAVQSFFVLSGFLMTSVMARTYGYSPFGFRQFWINRILRLFPTYLALIAVTVLLLVVIEADFARSYVNAMFMPQTAAEWVQVVTMLYADIKPIAHSPRLSPPTWALTLELVCYFLISVGITRSFGLTKIWLGAGTVFLCWALFASGHAWSWGYGSIPSAFVPFALGASIYHLQTLGRDPSLGLYPRLIGLMTRLGFQGNAGDGAVLALSVLAMVVLVPIRQVVDAAFASQTPAMLVYLANLLPAYVSVIAALRWKVEGARAKTWNRWAGDASYPIYIAHWTVAVACAAGLQAVTGETLARGFGLFALSALPILLVTALCIILIDRPVNRARDSVRSQATAAHRNG